MEILQYLCISRGRRGHDRMVVWFTTTYAISAYHHWCCEFESRSGQGVRHYVIKFVSDVTCDRSVVFSGSSGFLHQKTWSPRYNWNIVKSGIKLHQTNKHIYCRQIQAFFAVLQSNPAMMIFIYYRQIQAFFAMLQSNPAMMSALGRQFAALTRDMEKYKKLTEMEVC